ncbi:conserved hypothetical protein [Planktothrix serta PCC 8927]|uniref:Flagellar assembly protein H n=1 Tax=Planktothrix serta PCC 8927 TaxID=671068 RepID=A0A7Z9C3P3_9CYAN|nr:Rpn family recombination-promoting nuclease/putative transposase [Planktothrix serta]VXD24776.1 conserved hypothetical protein [Planktothrix serta PCC 8927]
MKTDSIFYRLFSELPSSFFELIGGSETDSLNYRFDSVELKQTAFRIDGVFLPLESTSQLPIYFVEVQFQKDPNIYARLFSEVFVYLRINNPAQIWRSVIIFKERNVEPDSLEPYQPLLDSNFVQRIYLDEWQVEPASIGLGIIQLVITPVAETPAKARQLLSQTQQTLEDVNIQSDVINLIETIVLYKLPNLSREELETMLGLNDLKQTRFAQEMLEEGEQKAKLESANRFLALGLSMEIVAQGLGLTLEELQQMLQKNPNPQ